MIPLHCDAAGTCTRPASTLVMLDDGAHGLCDTHDAAVRAMALQHLPDEAPRLIVVDLPEAVR